MGINQKKCRRPSGTRWVEHQVDNLASHNHNLPILIGCFNQHIIAPHNESIRKIKDSFTCHKNDATNLDYIIFNGAKEDILAILRPLSKSFLEMRCYFHLSWQISREHSAQWQSFKNSLMMKVRKLWNEMFFRHLPNCWTK